MRLHNVQRILYLTAMLICNVGAFSDMARAQVTIKERVVINPNNQTASPSKGQLPAQAFSDPEDTSLTVVTARFYYRGCQGLRGILRLVQSPCNNAYNDTVYGNAVNYESEQGLAQMQFVAYDSSSTPYQFTAVNPNCPTSFFCVCTHDSLVVTDNRGRRFKQTVAAGSMIVLDYRPPSGVPLCPGGSLQPQTFDQSSVRVYREGDAYRGYNQNGSICTDEVRVCPPSGTSDVIGVTGISNQTLSGCEPVPTFDYLGICLDATTNYWRLRIDGLQVPVISTLCPTSLTDLGDGTNTSLLQLSIQSCTDYQRVMKALDYWILGPYAQEQNGVIPSAPFPFFSSSGALAHENAHVDSLRNRFTGRFSLVLEGLNVPFLPSSCAREVVDGWSQQIKTMLRNAQILSFNDVLGIPDLELEADKFARPTYEEIQRRIYTWTRTTYPTWFILGCQ